MVRTKAVDANCATRTHPAFGVKRLALSQLLSSGGCAIDHSEPHRVKFHVALLITKGGAEHMVDYSLLTLQAGDLLLLRAGQVHAFARHGCLEGEIVTFTPEFLSTLAGVPSIIEAVDTIFGGGPRISLSEGSAKFLQNWYEEMSAEVALRGTPFGESRIACAFGLLVNRMAALEEFVLTWEAQQNRRPKLVRDFTALVEEHFLSHRDPPWYAKSLHMSVRTLDRQLAKVLRKTSKELITERVVLEAKRLLTDPDIQVKSVALSLCFDEVANFSRFFHNNAGLTPRDFRSQMPDWCA